MWIFQLFVLFLPPRSFFVVTITMMVSIIDLHVAVQRTEYFVHEQHLSTKASLRSAVFIV